MSAERVIAIAAFACSMLLLLRFGPVAIRSWRIYSGTPRRRQEDAAGQAPSMPPAVADRAAVLAELGYHPLGETRLVLPVGERFAWIVAADDAESYAILVDAPRIGGLTGLYTAWPDGTWLGTLHPRGDAVDRGGLEIRVVATTLEDAVKVQRAGLERLKRVHGTPRPIRTMPDMLALDADYRTRHGGVSLRTITARLIAPAIVLALLAVLSATLIALAR